MVHCSVQRDGTQMVSGSVQGDVVFWDLRGRAPVSVFEVHRSPMTALAVHGYAPLFASGSHNQFIKVTMLCLLPFFLLFFLVVLRLFGVLIFALTLPAHWI